MTVVGCRLPAFGSPRGDLPLALEGWVVSPFCREEALDSYQWFLWGVQEGETEWNLLMVVNRGRNVGPGEKAGQYKVFSEGIWGLVCWDHWLGLWCPCRWMTEGFWDTPLSEDDIVIAPLAWALIYNLWHFMGGADGYWEGLSLEGFGSS
jgi:hypothetical protein